MKTPDYVGLCASKLWPVSDASYFIAGAAPLIDRDLSRALMPMAVRELYSNLLAGIALGELESYSVSGCPEDCVRPGHAVRWATKQGYEVPVDLTVALGDLAEASDRGLQLKERDSLLKLVIGMARSKYKYDSTAKRSEAAPQIDRDLQENGIPLDQDTIRKWLRTASELLPQALDSTP